MQHDNMGDFEYTKDEEKYREQIIAQKTNSTKEKEGVSTVICIS